MSGITENIAEREQLLEDVIQVLDGSNETMRKDMSKTTQKDRRLMESGEEIPFFATSRSGNINPHYEEPTTSPIRNCRRKQICDSDDDDKEMIIKAMNDRTEAQDKNINWMKNVCYLKKKGEKLTGNKKKR